MAGVQLRVEPRHLPTNRRQTTRPDLELRATAIVRSRIYPHGSFQSLLIHLAEGDPSFLGDLSPGLGEVPQDVDIGDLFVATWSSQLVWYEALEPAREGRVFVRLYSRIFKTGDYDLVTLDLLAARVSRQLFERAKAHGFRTVRPLD